MQIDDFKRALNRVSKQYPDDHTLIWLNESLESMQPFVLTGEQVCGKGKAILINTSDLTITRGLYEIDEESCGFYDHVGEPFKPTHILSVE